MIADWFFISVAIFGSVAGTLTDIKARWSPDWISYLMVIFGLGGHAISSILQNNFWPFIYSLAAFGIMFGISATMFYTGVFAGGDAKMLMGFGALLPIAPAFVNAAPWPFFLTLLLNILLMGAVFGLVAAFGLAIKHKDKFKAEFKQEISKNKYAVYSASIVVLFMPIAAFYTNYYFILYFSFVTYALLVMLFFMKAIEKTCMFKFISPSKLVEGDWIVDAVTLDNYTYSPKKTGIEKQDIDKLKEFEILGKLKEVKVKEGFPMIPAFLAALLISLIFGDIIFSFVGYLI